MTPFTAEPEMTFWTVVPVVMCCLEKARPQVMGLRTQTSLKSCGVVLPAQIPS